MLDRVERSDVVNATALALVLLVLGYLIVLVFGMFNDSIDEGLWVAEGGESDEAVLDDIADSPFLLPTNEVSVIVGNGSEGRQGLAGRASRKLENLGFGALEPLNKEGDPIDDSLVYYIDGFKLEGIRVATLLNIEESQVRPLVGDPGVPTDGADIIVVLGQSADF